MTTSPGGRTKLTFILTNDKGIEFRFERYVLSPHSRMDFYIAEDSVVTSFKEIYGRYPSDVRLAA